MSGGRDLAAYRRYVLVVAGPSPRPAVVYPPPALTRFGTIIYYIIMCPREGISARTSFQRHLKAELRAAARMCRALNLSDVVRALVKSLPAGLCRVFSPGT